MHFNDPPMHPSRCFAYYIILKLIGKALSALIYQFCAVGGCSYVAIQNLKTQC